MEKLYIEARINEYATRGENKNIPWTVDEIVQDAVRCRENGATVLHYHARRPNGYPDNSYETNSEIIRRIKKECDILVYPTLGFNANDSKPRERIDAIARLCANPDTRPDIVPIDPGTVNIESYDAAAKTVDNTATVYTNSTETIIYAAEVFSSLDLTVQFFCWSVSFVRRGAMLIELGLMKRPPHFAYHLTTGKNISSNPPTRLGLESMLEVMPRQTAYPWGVACGGGSLLPLVPLIARLGGHVSIGLGDYPYPELGAPTNADLVSRAVELARENGRQIASIEETRRILRVGR